MDNQNIIIGAYIKHLRESKELTLDELGQFIGLSKQRISSIENGQIGKKKFKILAGISDYFGISAEKLIERAMQWHEDEEAKKRESFITEFRRDNNLKLLASINNHLARLVGLVEGGLGPGRFLHMTAKGDLQYESMELQLDIPPAPDHLNRTQIQQYDRNAGLLLRWSRTEKAKAAFPQGVPVYALEKFCENMVGFYGGGWIDDVTGCLLDLIQQRSKGNF